MATGKYTRKHRTWVRDVLLGITAGLGTNLVWLLVQAAAHRLG
ncbi:DUF6408 family protein [Streptomyces sp. NPDC047928]